MRMPQACCVREELALVSCVVALMLADAVDRRARGAGEDAGRGRWPMSSIDELSALQKHLDLKGPTLPKVLTASS